MRSPLPPNRRVRAKKAPAAIAAAPEEPIVAFDEQEPPQDAFGNEPVAYADGQSSRRWVEGLRAVLGVLVTVGAALASVWGLVRYTRTSPRFAIRTITVQGGSQRNPEQVARAGGIVVGQNLFTTDLESARIRLLEDPWIERASLVRRLPSTILVDIAERDAAAMVALGHDLYLSTREGELFKRFEPGDPADLPVITGVSTEQMAEERSQAVAAVKQALDLASEYEHAGVAKGLPLQEVHVTDDGSLILMVGKEPIALRMGKGPFRRPIDEATRVLARVAENHARPAVVFLDNDAHPERVVVRMR